MSNREGGGRGRRRGRISTYEISERAAKLSPQRPPRAPKTLKEEREGEGDGGERESGG